MGKYFSKDEAFQKVGKIVESLADFADVKKGTTGTVIRADYAGKSKPPFGRAVEVYDLAVQWHLKTEGPSAAIIESGGEQYLAVATGKPLVDWFTKDEYQRYLKEIA